MYTYVYYAHMCTVKKIYAARRWQVEEEYATASGLGCRQGVVQRLTTRTPQAGTTIMEGMLAVSAYAHCREVMGVPGSLPW